MPLWRKFLLSGTLCFRAYLFCILGLLRLWKILFFSSAVSCSLFFLYGFWIAYWLSRTFEKLRIIWIALKHPYNNPKRRVYIHPSTKTVYFSFEGNFICNSGDSTNQAPRYIIQLLIARIFPRKRVVTTTPVFGQPIIDSLIRQRICAWIFGSRFQESQSILEIIVACCG